jgi:hypothetical protein
MVIFIMLLAGFIPLLQVMFFTLLEDFYPGRLTVKDRDKTHRITSLILISKTSPIAATLLLGDARARQKLTKRLSIKSSKLKT